MKKDTGPSVRICNLARELAGLGNEVHIIIPGRRTMCREIDSIFMHEIRGFSPEKSLKAFCRLLGVLRHSSLYIYDPIFVGKALSIMLGCHTIQVEEPWAGGIMIPLLMKMLRRNFIIDSHDVFLPLRIQRPSIRKIFETFFEKFAYKFSKLIFTVSQKERLLLINYGIEKEKIVVIPSGVDTSNFKPSPTNIAKNVVGDSYEVVFVGNMEYAPNQQAVDLIASVIAPEVDRMIGNVKFIAVGRAPTELRSKYSSHITFTGTVSNVAKTLLETDVAIAPLLEGGGTRLKTLEYFACSLPVVSTSVGADGLDVKDGVNVLIEDDMEKFASKIVLLLKDRELAIKLGNAARKLVVAKYDWSKIGKQLNDVYLSRF